MLDAQIEENRGKLNRIVRALEEGVPASGYLSRIRELEAECQELLRKKEETETIAMELDNVVDVADAVKVFARDFIDSFDYKPVYEQRDLVRRTVSRIIFDHPNRTIRLYLRKIPLATEKLRRLIGEDQRPTKSKTASEIQMPFRKAEVAGTGLEPATFGL